MNEGVRLLLYWLPRILGLLFAAFLSVFALDVFTEGAGFWQTVAALLMHLVPSLIALIIVVVGWRWEWLGAVGFAAIGVLYLVMTWGRFPGMVYVSMSGPMFLISALFLVAWVLRAKLRPAR